MTAVVLDGRELTVREGCTVLEACRAHGVPLPTLCHLEGVTPAASCRLCLVEVRGLPRPVAACSTRVWGGMEIATATERLVRHRRGVVELLLSGGEHVCAFCPRSGRCELEALARALGVDHRDTRGGRRARPLDATRARFALDPGRCVLCSRCVRVCAELEGARTLHLVGRGARTRVAPDAATWGESPTCTDCGRCVAACPTGALLEKAVAAQGLSAQGLAAPELAAGGLSAQGLAAPEPGSPELAAAGLAAQGLSAPEPGSPELAAAGLAAPERPAPARPPAPPGPALPAPSVVGRRARIATVWLGGCSGCHMSLLDLDEALLDLAPRIELVFSPLSDARAFPDGVDACLVEGAVATEAHRALLREARARSRLLVALGDCAGSGNVTALRDAAGGADAVLRSAGLRGIPLDPALPTLLDPVLPVHAVVPVDVFLPGCPPAAPRIGEAIAAAAAGVAAGAAAGLAAAAAAGVARAVPAEGG